MSNPNPNLQGKKAVVIGGTSGIGLATAKQLAAQGVEIIVTGRQSSKLAAVVNESSGSITGKQVDGTDEEQMRAFFGEAGQIDYLILATGTQAKPSPFHQLEEANFRRDFDEKFWLYVRAIRMAWGKVRESYTMLTGAAARSAVPDLSPYAATNGALEAMVRPLALELSPVRINAVSAGLTETPFWDWMTPEARTEMYQQAVSLLAVRRIAQPEDIAQALVYAATNRFTTGTVIEVDGGAHLGGFRQT